MRIIPPLLVCAAITASSVPAAAQAQPASLPALTPVQPQTIGGGVFVTSGINVDGSQRAQVIDRILSFDVDGDNRVGRDELPDRMSDLFPRGDVDKDGFLSAAEVKVLVDQQSSASAIDRFAIQRKSVTIADVISDLRLAKPTHDVVMELVKSYSNIRIVNNSRQLGQLDLNNYLRDLLSAEEYENYEAAIARVRSSPQAVTHRIVVKP